MKEKNNIPKGYKPSVLGPIPEDWEVKHFGEVLDIFVGRDLREANYSPVATKDHKYPVYSNTVDNFGLYGFYDLEEYKGNCLTIVGRGVGLGTAFTRRKSFGAIGRLLVLYPKKGIEPHYVTEFVNGRLNIFVESSGIPQLTGEQMAIYRIAIPPPEEQTAIANLLSTWDNAINTLTQLIAQKEQRKKWLMQQLLTGKKRLKGFRGEWREVKLGEIFEEISEINDGGDLHSVMTISSRQGFISQTEKFDRIIAGDSLQKYTQLRKNDFAYNKGNSKSYPMGCIYQLEDHKTALVPFVYICFRSVKGIDSKFYKHWFLAHGLDRQLKRIISSGARGDGLLNVNSHDFFQLKIPHPSREEQSAISTVMESADTELNLLNMRLDKLKNQKKGLMQILLTGKKRIRY